jgi:hypothetical protein
MAEKNTFRSALNGFNREDVVHYIEYLNSKHTAQINQLESENAELRSKLEALQSQAAAAAEEAEAAVEEVSIEDVAETPAAEEEVGE